MFQFILASEFSMAGIGRFVDTMVVCDHIFHSNHRLRVSSGIKVLVFRRDVMCRETELFLGISSLCGVTVSCFCEHILQFKSSTFCCGWVFSYVLAGRSCCRRLVCTLYTMSGMFLHFVVTCTHP